jgi:peptidoglycan hydrolase CwlO-like protein
MMEGLIKNKIFLFSALFNVTFLIFMIASCSETQRQKDLVAKEMLSRLMAEEKLEASAKEKQDIEREIVSLRRQLQEEKDSHELTQKALLQEKMVIRAVKEELSKATRGGESH